MSAASLAVLRALPWMTDATWQELQRASVRGTHLEEISQFLKTDPTNGRQLVHVISRRLEKTVERLLSLGASADVQRYSVGESSLFHPIDCVVSVSPYPWSRRIADMVFAASRDPFAVRETRPLLSRAIEVPDAVDWCLARGADPNQQSSRGYTALAASAQSFDHHIPWQYVRRSFRTLINAGADLDVLVAHPNALSGDAACTTAAAIAIGANRWGLARLLLARGANPDIGGEHSARSVAIAQGNDRALRLMAAWDMRRLMGATPATFAPRRTASRI